MNMKRPLRRSLSNGVIGVAIGCLVIACSPSSEPSAGEAVAKVPDRKGSPVPLVGDAEPKLGRCYMNECSWSAEKGRAVIKSDETGKLIKLTLIGGTSHHDDAASYPSKFTKRERIAWSPRSHDVFVFCSRKLPSVIIEDNGAWQVDVLDFVNGPPGILESSANIYASVCHGDADWSASGFAKQYGYSSLTEAQQSVTVARPDDIFRVAGQEGLKEFGSDGVAVSKTETGWVPDTPNTLLTAVSDDDVPTGAGCALFDRSGAYVGGWEAGGSLILRVGGAKLELPARNEEDMYFIPAFSDGEWTARMSYGEVVSEEYESSSRKLMMRLASPTRAETTISLRVSCGS